MEIIASLYLIGATLYKEKQACTKCGLVKFKSKVIQDVEVALLGLS